MKLACIVLAVLGLAGGPALAADAEAVREKTRACAACHGVNGLSVADDIPNLAGQKAKYLAAQLKAFKDGSRKNPLMNAIAAQLDDADIESLAAFWNGLPAAGGDMTSALLPAVSATRVRFPQGYRESFTHYTTIDFPKTGQVRRYYANPTALAAARDGRPLPAGSYLFVEVFAARRDADGKPVTGADGFYEPGELLFFTAMEMQDGWGAEIPELLRNGDWNYAVFAPDGTLRTDVNHAQCLACHKPLDADSYVFSLKKLAEKP